MPFRKGIDEKQFGWWKIGFGKFLIDLYLPLVCLKSIVIILFYLSNQYQINTEPNLSIPSSYQAHWILCKFWNRTLENEKWLLENTGREDKFSHIDFKWRIVSNLVYPSGNNLAWNCNIFLLLKFGLGYIVSKGGSVERGENRN